MTCYVYIAAEGESADTCKVGISSNPLRRIRKLNTAWIGQRPLVPIYFVQCGHRSSAYLIEQSTLKRIKAAKFKVRQEIAWCPPATAVGMLQLAWQASHPSVVKSVQIELFGEDYDDAA